MSDNGESILQELLGDEFDDLDNHVYAASNGPEDPTQPPQASEKPSRSDKESHVQWALGGNDRYMPVGSTAPKLKPGIYEPFAVPGMWGVELVTVESDGIYALPDMATDIVIKEAHSFWANEARYRNHGLLYKRGIIMWGPPGGGKTATVKLLMSELLRRDGLVLIVNSVDLSIQVLKAVRRIEPNRNLIVVMEDIDEIINHQGEGRVLSMLDGEHNIDRVLVLATTNYPERLGARIINRPSRFDRRIYIGMPSDDARRVYLLKKTHNGLAPEVLDKWVKDTKDMSIAHLRELVAAVYCLDQPYDDVLQRLKDMNVQPKEVSGFKTKNLGFSKGFTMGPESN